MLFAKQIVARGDPERRVGKNERVLDINVSYSVPTSRFLQPGSEERKYRNVDAVDGGSLAGRSPFFWGGGVVFHGKTQVVFVSPKPTDGEERGRLPAFMYISGSSSEGFRGVASHHPR